MDQSKQNGKEYQVCYKNSISKNANSNYKTDTNRHAFSVLCSSKGNYHRKKCCMGETHGTAGMNGRGSSSPES